MAAISSNVEPFMGAYDVNSGEMQVLGRTLVVHDFATGRRIGCGQIRPGAGPDFGPSDSGVVSLGAFPGSTAACLLYTSPSPRDS